MKAKFTPGPWRIAFSTEITTSPVGIVEGGKRIAECANTLKPFEEVKANAALIAAAPELLEALEALLDAFKNIPDEWLSDECGGWDQSMFDNAEIAITKAKGGN